MSDLRASIVVIGDEILGGFVHDTNSHWLARQLQAHGIPLDRVQTVPDEIEAIQEGLDLELARSRPRLVMTSGGIGSTPDDLTMEAVAVTLGRPLVVNSEIDAKISQALEWTARQGVTVTGAHESAMRSMAKVPEGTYLLAGSTGVAPGVAVDIDGGLRDGGATIVILPGIPTELRRIYTGGIAPELLQGRGHPAHVVEISHSYPESTLTPVLAQLVEGFADVHIGSYPGEQCLIRLIGRRTRVEAAADLVDAYLAELDGEPGGQQLKTAWAARWRDAAAADAAEDVAPGQ